MTTYARIRGGIVAELFTPPTGVAITACFAPSMTWAECYGTPGVAPGWAATEVAGAWTFSAPPAPPAPTLAQQAQALLAGSLTIASTSTPALNGSYAIDPATQVHMQAEMLCVTVNGAFADGTSSLAWPDAGGTARHGTAHVFSSAAEFKAFALAVAAFVAGCFKVIDGTSTTLPSASVTIS
jgi:hypothetical protein